MNVPAFDDDEAWRQWQAAWRIRGDTIYLNHGSFGPPPEPVRAARRMWQARLDDQPMDFFVRQFEPAWCAARDRLAALVGTRSENLVLVENSTVGMNLVARNFPLGKADQVVLTNHEYGAVARVWRRACLRAGAAPPVIARLPARMECEQEVVDAIFAGIGERVVLLVVSHITSPTATILPVAAICREAQARGIAVCIDGPHAPAQVPLNIDELGCDFYAASCHKWLSAPFGSGFLAVSEQQQQQRFEPDVLSWGRQPPRQPETWWDEFVWSGTRDPSSFLATPAAIDFFEHVGADRFRERTHALAGYARRRLVELTGREPPMADSPRWYGAMALVPLPPCDAKHVQRLLWQRRGIEVPVIEFEQNCYIRVSCHLYNTPRHVDLLVAAVGELL